MKECSQRESGVPQGTRTQEEQRLTAVSITKDSSCPSPEGNVDMVGLSAGKTETIKKQKGFLQSPL